MHIDSAVGRGGGSHEPARAMLVAPEEGGCPSIVLPPVLIVGMGSMLKLSPTSRRGFIVLYCLRLPSRALVARAKISPARRAKA